MIQTVETDKDGKVISTTNTVMGSGGTMTGWIPSQNTRLIPKLDEPLDIEEDNKRDYLISICDLVANNFDALSDERLINIACLMRGCKVASLEQWQKEIKVLNGRD